MNKKKNRNVRPAGWKFLAVVAAGFVALAAVIFYVFAPQPGAQSPHYFMTAAAAKPLPETLDPAQFPNKDVAAAYRAAKAAPEVLAQQPCFCHCDRKMGHRSLLDCFGTKHAAECDVCVKEAIFADREGRNGKSAAEIRAEIIRGDWKTVELAK